MKAVFFAFCILIASVRAEDSGYLSGCDIEMDYTAARSTYITSKSNIRNTKYPKKVSLPSS